MDKYRLFSNYTVKQYKAHKTKYNEEKIDNIVNRKFHNRSDLEIVVSDLTYVNVSGKWHYICLLINLFNREIVGYSAGNKKDAELVYEAFMNTNINLTKVKIFHTDRGNEFKNKIIDEVLDAFRIKRSLAEAGYKIIKTEFTFNRVLENLEELKKNYKVMFYVITINAFIVL